MHTPSRTFVIIWIALLRTIAAAATPTTLPAVFGDHMVLQRGLPLPVWGRAEPGTVVTVTLADQMLRATADAGGAWFVRAAPLVASATPVTFAVSDAAGPVATFDDVLIGDVWVASGQSNMELAVKATADADVVINNANEPQVRLFQVQRTNAAAPQFDCHAKWTPCTPASAATFSAVAYYFARDIHDTQHVPVGVVGSYAAGTQIEPWISLDGFMNLPLLKRWGDAERRQAIDLPQLQARYTAEMIPAWQKRHDDWDRDVAPAYHLAMAAWNLAAADAKTSGARLPPKPKPASPEPKRPDPPTTNPHKLGNLFNGMIAPVVPLAIKGVIWYQGEANADRPGDYATLFPGLIADWRQRWNQAGDKGSLTHDFPFLFVQLANFVAYPNTDWPGLRDAQSHTRKIAANTAMVVTLDVGGDNDLHYKNKAPVGHRLALAARHVAYGETAVRFEGPTLRSAIPGDGAITLTFDHVVGGLAVRAPATQPATGVAATTQPTVAPAAFTIAGEDGRFIPAVATLTGPDTVRLSSPDVPRPLFVRYAWANTPHVNLFNGDGLPVEPFRTDPGPTAEPAP